MDPTSMFGPLDLLYPVIEYVLLVLVLANLGTRYLAHRSTVQAYRSDGLEGMSRHPAHVVTNVLLAAATFYFMTVDFGSGVVMSLFVLGLILSDFFEFEARMVEARKEDSLQLPHSALLASALTLLYASYLALFFVVEPLWDQVIV